jgi:hypothetical protein
MLTELQRLHADILASLDELDALTAQPRPPMDRLPSVRLALTRASRARTMLLERRYDQLIARATSEQKAAILSLKAEGKDNLVTSTQHIGAWTLREIAGRWPEYCAASSTIRSAMRQRIRKEAALIYPLLSGPAVHLPAA